MTAFHDIALPLALARGSVGGPERRTDIIALGDGRDARNTAFAGSRRRWDIGSAIRSIDDLAEIAAFFEARRGKLHGFRFKDPADNKSCAPSRQPAASDQWLGTGTGAQRAFQLTKRYGDRAGSHIRAIQLPVIGSVRVQVSGTPLPPNAFEVAPLGGLVTLETAPALGAEIRAGFLFDTPVRFDSDRMDIAHDAVDAGRIVSLSLIEVVL